MKIQKFIGAVIEEKDGFVLDEPWRMSEESLNVIVPVKREVDEKRDYITFAEAQDVKVEDTGMIDYVYVKNNEDVPLLISRGEIFRGKTQERAAIHGHIVLAGKGQRVAVRCIHQSKGIQKGADMKYGGRTPYDIDLSNQGSTWNSVNLYSCSVYGEPQNAQVKLSNRRLTKKSGLKSRGVESQNVYASNVSDETSGVTSEASSTFTTSSSVNLNDSIDNGVDMMFASMDSLSSEPDEPTRDVPASDDLAATLDDLSSSIREAMKKIPPIENQVGAIFITENKVKGMDIYNLPDSWQSVKDDVVEKEGSSFMKKEENNLFEFNPKKVKGLLGKELLKKFKEKVIYGEAQGQPYKIIEFREEKDEKDKSSTKLIGEAVEFNNKIIHLTLFRV